MREEYLQWKETRAKPPVVRNKYGGVMTQEDIEAEERQKKEEADRRNKVDSELTNLLKTPEAV